MSPSILAQKRKASSIVGFQLGLFDPDPGSSKLIMLPQTFATGPRSRKQLRAIIARFNRRVRRMDSSLCAGVFPVRDQ